METDGVIKQPIQFSDSSSENVLDSLKACMRLSDVRELKIRAKAVIVRYDNPLTIAYS